MTRTVDLEIRKKYELAYFSRNFKAKIRDAYEWALSDEDIALIIEAWKIKADNLGPEGKKRWGQLCLEFPEMEAKYKRVKGIAWTKPSKERELQKIGLQIERGENL